MNVEMDRMAKAYWRHCYIHNHLYTTQPLQPPQQAIYLEGWTLWNGDTKVVNPSRQNLYDLIQDPITISKWR